MKAIILNEFGGPENLIHTEIEMPAIKNGEVLVQVKAISVNPVDVKTRKGSGIAGRLNMRPLVLGWDISGVVTQSQSPAFQVGDDVFGMVNFPGHGQAYAEYVAAPASHLALKPANISHNEAAAATLAPLTAWLALVTHGNVKAGQMVLIHAASGGVGHYAVQLAKHMGAYVIGTSSAENRDFVMGLGADQHIDYKTERFEDTVRDADFVLENIGGDHTLRSLKALKPGGRLISIVGANDAVKAAAQAKGVTAEGILVNSADGDITRIADLLHAGQLKSHVSHIYPFAEMDKAHQQVESGRTVGKVIVAL